MQTENAPDLPDGSPARQTPGKTTVEAFFAAAASTAPVPGGGSVTAVCGYLGAALLLKSIRISGRRGPDPVYARYEERILALATRLLAAAQADSDAFSQYMRAAQLPKQSLKEQSARQAAMHDASLTATQSALDILDLGNAVLDCAHQLQFRVVAAIQADVRAGIELISAMNITARENALSNLAGASATDALRRRLDQAFANYEKLLAACRSSP